MPISQRKILDKPRQSRILLFLVFSVVGLFAGVYFGGLYYLTNALKGRWAKASMLSITRDIKSAQPVPSCFLAIEHVIEGERKTSRKAYPFLCIKTITGLTITHDDLDAGNYSAEIYDLLKMKYPSIGLSESFVSASMIYRFGLEEEFTAEELLNYYFANCLYLLPDSGSRRRYVVGLQDISQYKFNRPVEALTKDQLIELYLMTADKPRHFYLNNPERYPERIRLLKTIYDLRVENKITCVVCRPAILLG